MAEPLCLLGITDSSNLCLFYAAGFCLHQFILRWYGRMHSSLSPSQDASDGGINRSEMKSYGNARLLRNPSLMGGFGSQITILFQPCMYSRA